MKVQRTAETTAAPAREPFREALKEAAQPPVAPLKGRVLAGVRTPARGTLRSAASLQRADRVVATGRARVEAEAKGLEAARQAPFQPGAVEAAPSTRERRKLQVLELITQELVSALEGGASAVANDGPPPQATVSPLAPAPTTPSPRREEAEDSRQAFLDRSRAAMALIERIQVFVRNAQRPSLSLTLDNSLGARVEIERLGPGLVAVKLVGHKGPPSPEAVGRVREEILARGLKVGALSVE